MLSFFSISSTFCSFSSLIGVVTTYSSTTTYTLNVSNAGAGNAGVGGITANGFMTTSTIGCTSTKYGIVVLEVIF